MLFLLAVVDMPFSSAFYSEYVMRGVRLPIIIYVLNIMFLGFMGLAIWNYIANPKRQLSEGITPEMSRYVRIRSFVPPIAFLLTALVYFYNPMLAPYVPIIIPVAMRIIRKYYTPSKSEKHGST